MMKKLRYLALEDYRRHRTYWLWRVTFHDRGSSDHALAQSVLLHLRQVLVRA